MIYLDTHAFIWLVTKEEGRFTKKTVQRLSEEDLLISPMVLLEVEYLHEIGRVKVGAEKFMEVGYKECGVEICKAPFPEIIQICVMERWTRDPFDRILVAQARINKAPLLSLDETIKKNYNKTFW